MEATGGTERLRILVPEAYLCPISRDIMWDPVIVFESEQTYDRSSIETWFERGHNTDPMTNQVLLNPAGRATVLALRNAIRTHLRGMPPFCGLKEEDWRAANVVFESVEGTEQRGEGDALPVAPRLRCVQTLALDSVVTALAVAPDGDLFSCNVEGSVQQWRGAACVATLLEAHTYSACALAVAPDGSVFSAGNPSNTTGWNTTAVLQWRGGRCVAKLEGHEGWVRCLATAADGSVYSGSYDKTIRQWRGGVCVAELRGHTELVISLAVALDGVLFSGSDDCSIRMWRGGECVATLRVPGGQKAMALALAPDGSLFSGGGRFGDHCLGGGQDFAIRQWRAGRCVATLEGHQDCVSALAVAADGSLFSGSWDKTVRQWRGGRCVAVLEDHTEWVNALALAPDGSLFSGSRDKTIKQWR